MLYHGEPELIRHREFHQDVTGRQHCRWCGWVAILAFLGFVKLMVATTLQHQHLRTEHDAFLTLGQSKDNFFSDALRIKRKKKRKEHKLSWKFEGKYSDKCTNDLHELIDEKDLEWPTNRPLPEFKATENRGGGAIIFWHVAKTGGTTVRKRCASLPGVDYLLLVKPEDYYKGANIIADYLSPVPEDETPDAANHHHNHTLFVELHGMDGPTVLEMQDQIALWRKLSRIHNTPLFIFTILREPISYSVSYFNFFHQEATTMPTAEDLARTAFNRQCMTLGSSPTYNKRICALLYKKFNTYFDWVGTTEKMSEETLPLLQHLLRFKPAQERFAETNATSFLLPTSTTREKYNAAVPRNFTIHRDDITPKIMEGLEDRTCLDRGLWERAGRDYTLDMFEDSIDRKLL